MLSIFKSSNKYKGFTAIEMLMVLVLFIGLVMVGNSVLDDIYTMKKNNQLADQIKTYQYAAIRYINDNYRTINQQTAATAIVIPIAGLSAYLPLGTGNALSNGMQPCIYIPNNADNALKAYLIFVTTGTTSLSFTNAIAVARSIGGNAGVLLAVNNGFRLEGLNQQDTLLPATLAVQCGFNISKGANNLIIDITANNKLFPQLKTLADPSVVSRDEDPSLKRSGNGSSITMQANLYLDNTVKESSSLTQLYCDAAKLPINDALSSCDNYASTTGLKIYAGTASWISSELDQNQKCNATASAHFYSIINDYNCVGKYLPSADNYCPFNNPGGGGQTKISGSAFWSPAQPQLSGNQCISNAYAYYCTTWQYHYNSCWHDNVITCQSGSVYNIPAECNHGAYQMQCNGNIWWSNDPLPSCFKKNPTPISCTQNQQPANGSQQTVDKGYQSCTPTSSYPPLSSTSGVPAQHVYRSLDFGPAAIAGQRVLVHSHALPGPDSSRSKLSIDNAGIQSGIIAPVSHFIASGSLCNEDELGTIAQQQDVTGSGGQLQCSYSPVFCNGNAFCYIPLKQAGIIYSFQTAVTNATCPAGTTVAANQASDGISQSVKCPVFSGLTLTQGVHGETYACYSILSGFSFCPGYQTLCTYRDVSGVTQKIPVAALLSLTCSSATSTLTVDNYTQQ